jgi:hypothetical protein
MEQDGPTENQHQSRTIRTVRTVPVTVISFTKIQLKSNNSRNKSSFVMQAPLYQTKRRYTSEARDHPEQHALSEPLCDALPRRETQFHTQEIRNSLLHLLLPSSFFIRHFFF